MAKRVINIGQTANDRSGDPLRTAFSKINENFTELYDAVAADVQIPSVAGNDGKVLTTDGVTIAWSPLPSSATDLGNFKISGEYMGTKDNPDTGGWGGYDMVFSPNDNNAWITIPNDTNSVAGNSLRLGNYGDGGIEMITARGNVNFGGNIEVPGVPTHFHIAFTQSNLIPPYGELFLGDDFNAVQIHGQDGAPYFGVNIRATDRQTEGAITHQWRFGTDGTTTLPDAGKLQLDGDHFYIQRTMGAHIVSEYGLGIDTVDMTNPASPVYHNWAFGTDGKMYFPDGSQQTTAWLGNTGILSGTVTPAVGNRVTGVRPPDGAGANLGYIWVPNAPTELTNIGDITGYTISWDQGPWTATVVQMRYDLGAPYGIQPDSGFPAFGPGDTYTYTSPNYQPAVPNNVTLEAGTSSWIFSTNGSISGGNTSGNLDITASNYVSIDSTNGGQINLGRNQATNANSGTIAIGHSGNVTVLYSGQLRIMATHIPTSSAGTAGDVAGLIAFDKNYIYYCIANYGSSPSETFTVTNAGENSNVIKVNMANNPNYTVPQAGWTTMVNGVTMTLTAFSATDVNGVDFDFLFDVNSGPIPSTVTLTSNTPYTNIWKRVQWSNDTW